MPPILIPDLAGPFTAHHAGPNRALWRAVLAEEATILGTGYPGHNISADTLLGQAGGGLFQKSGEINLKALPGIYPGVLGPHPEIAIRDMGNPSPVPPLRLEYLP